jgi:hypothetical protein
MGDVDGAGWELFRRFSSESVMAAPQTLAELHAIARNRFRAMTRVTIYRCPDSKEIGEYAYLLASPLNEMANVNVIVAYGDAGELFVDVGGEPFLAIREPLPPLVSISAMLKARLKA